MVIGSRLKDEWDFPSACPSCIYKFLGIVILQGQEAELASAGPDELSKNSRTMNWTDMSRLGSCANSLKISKIEKRNPEIHPMTT